ncbi:alginate O-acetyltransferase AlgX-related protein [Nitrospira sp. Nam80]
MQAKLWGRYKSVALATIILFVAGYAILFMTGVSSIRHLLDNVIALYLITWGLYGLLSNLPRSEIGKRFILTSLTIGLCVVLAEGAAMIRLVDFRGVFGTFEAKNALGSVGRRFDSELLWKYEPYYSFEANYQGNLGRGLCIPPDASQRVHVRYDRHGFRNNRDLSQADIVVIGDSYIEAPMTPDAALATTLLSQLQGKTVANLGNSGYGPQQELGVLKRFGLGLRPEAVVWAFFEGNDFSNAEQYDVSKKMLSGENPYWQDFWFRSFSRNLLALYFRSMKDCRPSTSIQQYKGEFRDQTNAATPVFFASSEVVTPSEDEMKTVSEYILEAYRLCRQQEIRFLVAFVPEKYRVYHDLSNFEFGTEELRSWKVNDLPSRLKQILTASAPDIEYLDLTPALKAESGKGIATYLPDDTHWTPVGHRVAAEAIDRALSAREPHQIVRMGNL